MNFLPVPMLTGLLLVAAALVQPAHADSPEVVASIKPVHSLAAALMEGVGEPRLLIKGGGSPHVYALRPSEARALQRADLVVWVGDEMETFLARPLGTLAADARIVTLSEADGLRLLPSREGGGWESHDHHGEDHEDGDHEHGGHEDGGHEDGGHEDGGHEDGGHEEHAENEGHDHEAGEFDMHIWLDPRNAAAMARSTAAALIDADPDNEVAYRANLARFEADMVSLEGSIGESLQAVRDRPFVVFHDAYQYFERRFDLNAVGSITVSPEIQPGAARLRELRQTIAATRAQCVFSEPQFEPRLLETVVEGTDAAAGVLDPLGSGLPAGPDHYTALMRGMAESLLACLAERDDG